MIFFYFNFILSKEINICFYNNNNSLCLLKKYDFILSNENSSTFTSIITISTLNIKIYITDIINYIFNFNEIIGFPEFSFFGLTNNSQINFWSKISKSLKFSFNNLIINLKNNSVVNSIQFFSLNMSHSYFQSNLSITRISSQTFFLDCYSLRSEFHFDLFYSLIIDFNDINLINLHQFIIGSNGKINFINLIDGIIFSKYKFDYLIHHPLKIENYIRFIFFGRTEPIFLDHIIFDSTLYFINLFSSKNEHLPILKLSSRYSNIHFLDSYWNPNEYIVEIISSVELTVSFDCINVPLLIQQDKILNIKFFSNSKISNFYFPSLTIYQNLISFSSYDDKINRRINFKEVIFKTNPVIFCDSKSLLIYFESIILTDDTKFIGPGQLIFPKNILTTSNKYFNISNLYFDENLNSVFPFRNNESAHFFVDKFNINQNKYLIHFNYLYFQHPLILNSQIIPFCSLKNPSQSLNFDFLLLDLKKLFLSTSDYYSTNIITLSSYFCFLFTYISSGELKSKNLYFSLNNTSNIPEGFLLVNSKNWINFIDKNYKEIEFIIEEFPLNLSFLQFNNLLTIYLNGLCLINKFYFDISSLKNNSEINIKNLNISFINLIPNLIISKLFISNSILDETFLKLINLIQIKNLFIDFISISIFSNINLTTNFNLINLNDNITLISQGININSKINIYCKNISIDLNFKNIIIDNDQTFLNYLPINLNGISKYIKINGNWTKNEIINYDFVSSNEIIECDSIYFPIIFKKITNNFTIKTSSSILYIQNTNRITSRIFFNNSNNLTIYFDELIVIKKTLFKSKNNIKVYINHLIIEEDINEYLSIIILNKISFLNCNSFLYNVKYQLPSNYYINFSFFNFPDILIKGNFNKTLNFDLNYYNLNEIDHFLINKFKFIYEKPFQLICGNFLCDLINIKINGSNNFISSCNNKYSDQNCIYLQLKSLKLKKINEKKLIIIIFLIILIIFILNILIFLIKYFKNKNLIKKFKLI